MHELDSRRLSDREASLTAGLDHAAIHRYLTGTKPSSGNCAKLAAYFEVPEDYVLELVGHKHPSAKHSLFVKQLDRLTADWTGEEQQLAMELLQTVERRRRASQ